jgi:hypothetical protein
VIAAYAIAFGVMAMGSALWLPIPRGDSVLLSLGGLLSTAFSTS